jgi:hypothetical protein
MDELTAPTTSNSSHPACRKRHAVGPVRWALRRQNMTLCARRALERRFDWIAPPRNVETNTQPVYPMLEEELLLLHPKPVRGAEKRLLGLLLLPADCDEDDEEPYQPGP